MEQMLCGKRKNLFRLILQLREARPSMKRWSSPKRGLGVLSYRESISAFTLPISILVPLVQTVIHMTGKEAVITRSAKCED